MRERRATWHTAGVVSAVFAPLSVSPSAGLLLAVGDPARTRAVWVSIAVLVAVGGGLIVLAVWLFRTTRVDPEVLAPLETMGERSWRAADPPRRHRQLAEARSDGADPLDGDVLDGRPPAGDRRDGDLRSDAGAGAGRADDDGGDAAAGPARALRVDEIDELLRGLGVDLDELTPSPDGDGGGAQAPDLAGEPEAADPPDATDSGDTADRR